MSQEKQSEQILHLLEQQGFSVSGSLKQQLAAQGISLDGTPDEDTMICDALAFHGRQIAQWRQEVQLNTTLSAQQKLLMRYSVLEEHVRRGRFPGCLFIAACSVYPDARHPIHQETEKQKQASWQYTHQQLLALQPDNPAMVADQLELVLEGCLSKLLVKRNLQDIATARRLAEDILQMAICRKNGALG